MVVFAFSDDELYAILFNTFRLSRECFVAIFKDYPATQTFDLFWGNGITKGDYIRFWEMTFWRDDTMIECSIARSNDESLRIDIESSSDMN